MFKLEAPFVPNIINICFKAKIFIQIALFFSKNIDIGNDWIILSKNPQNLIIYKEGKAIIIDSLIFEEIIVPTDV